MKKLGQIIRLNRYGLAKPMIYVSGNMYQLNLSNETSVTINKNTFAKLSFLFNIREEIYGQLKEHPDNVITK